MKRTIGKYASRPVVAVDSEASVQDALQLMSENRISCIVVLAHDEPVGILTERDIVFAANWLLGQPDLLVKEVMNKPVMTASEDISIYQAYQTFCEHRIRHLVVLDARLNMVGIFTQTDLVRALSDKSFPGYNDVSSLMSPQVLQVDFDVPARYALSLMARRSVSGIVVMKDGQPAGMFTERDVVNHIAHGIDLGSVAVGEVMSQRVVSTLVTTTPQESIGLMLKQSIRRLLVVDSVGKMAGILTQTDVGRVLDNQDPGLLGQIFGDVGFAAGASQGAA